MTIVQDWMCVVVKEVAQSSSRQESSLNDNKIKANGFFF